jgi:hypothetical protein
MTMDEVLFRSEFDRDGDYVFVEPLTNDEDGLEIGTAAQGGTPPCHVAYLDREEVQRLRDKLTDWLADEEEKGDAAPNPEIPRRVSGVAFSPEVMRALAKLSTVVGSTPLHITSPEFPNVRVVVKGIPASVAVEVHA